MATEKNVRPYEIEETAVDANPTKVYLIEATSQSAALAAVVKGRFRVSTPSASRVASLMKQGTKLIEATEIGESQH